MCNNFALSVKPAQIVVQCFPLFFGKRLSSGGNLTEKFKTTGINRTAVDGEAQGAAGFLSMAAVGEAALSEVGRKFGEALFDLTKGEVV